MVENYQIIANYFPFIFYSLSFFFHRNNHIIVTNLLCSMFLFQIFERWNIWQWNRVMPHIASLSNKSGHAGADQHPSPRILRH
jgi:hypothetical protein